MYEEYEDYEREYARTQDSLVYRLVAYKTLP